MVVLCVGGGGVGGGVLSSVAASVFVSVFLCHCHRCLASLSVRWALGSLVTRNHQNNPFNRSHSSVRCSTFPSLAREH